MRAHDRDTSAEHRPTSHRRVGTCLPSLHYRRSLNRRVFGISRTRSYEWNNVAKRLNRFCLGVIEIDQRDISATTSSDSWLADFAWHSVATMGLDPYGAKDEYYRNALAWL